MNPYFPLSAVFPSLILKYRKGQSFCWMPCYNMDMSLKFQPRVTIPVEVVDLQDYLHSLKYIYRRWQGNPVASAEVNQNIQPARAFYGKFGLPKTDDRVYGVGQ